MQFFKVKKNVFTLSKWLLHILMRMIPVLVSQEKTAPVPAPVPTTVQEEEEPSGETDTPTSVAPPPEPSPVKAAPTGTDMVAEKTEGLFIVITQQTMFDFVCEGGRAIWFM